MNDLYLNHSRFLEFAIQAEKVGEIDTGLDIIYDHVDMMMQQGYFNILDKMLESVIVTNYSADILLGLLTSTFPAKSKLICRENFFNRVYLHFKSTQQENLLKGLE